MKNYKNWSTNPESCPYCGSTNLRMCVEWDAVSREDKDNKAELTEYQCMGKCEGRSFWA